MAVSDNTYSIETGDRRFISNIILFVGVSSVDIRTLNQYSNIKSISRYQHWF